jgi:hypothetical protein
VSLDYWIGGDCPGRFFVPEGWKNLPPGAIGWARPKSAVAIGATFPINGVGSVRIYGESETMPMELAIDGC